MDIQHALQQIVDRLIAQLPFAVPAAFAAFYWTTTLINKNGPTLKTPLRIVMTLPFLAVLLVMPAGVFAMRLITGPQYSVMLAIKRMASLVVDEHRKLAFEPGVFTWFKRRLPQGSFVRKVFTCPVCMAIWMSMALVTLAVVLPVAYQAFALVFFLPGAITILMSFSGSMPMADREARE